MNIISVDRQRSSIYRQIVEHSYLPGRQNSSARIDRHRRHCSERIAKGIENLERQSPAAVNSDARASGKPVQIVAAFKPQGSGIDNQWACKGIFGIQLKIPCSGHGERARAADDAREGLVAGAGVDEVAAVCDGSGVAAASELARSGDRERAGADGGRASVGVCGREGEGAGGVFRERAGAADDAREGLVGGAGVDEVAAV